MTRRTGPDQVVMPNVAHAAWPCRRAAGLAFALSLAAAPVLTACSSASAHSSATAAVPSAAAITAACNQVGAALSDGPDPDADPVGYAEAQIKPLRAIRTSDPALRMAIGDLASAYARVLGSNAKSAVATSAVAAAGKKVSAICPGVAA